MRLKIIAMVSYAFYVVCHLSYLYINFTHYEDGRTYSATDLPGDLASLLLPLIFAGVASLVVKLFKHDLYVRVFQWIVICFSLLIGLFSVFAAYLSWWAATH